MAATFRLIVVCVSTFAFHQIMPVATDSLLFDYDGTTLAECRDHYQVEFSPKCTKVCPPSTPLLFHNLCVSSCPRGLIRDRYSSNWCRKAYQQSLNTERNQIPNLKCRQGSCPSERPFCLDYQCHVRCPVNTLNEEFSCVQTCSKKFPYVLNDSCVKECPEEKPYNEDGKCVSSCNSRLVNNDGKCIEQCPDNSSIYNNTCVDQCPAASSFYFRVWNTSFCLTSCPAFTVIRGDTCDVGCPQGFHFVWNQTCVRICPETNRFQYVLTERLPFHKIPICLPKCPDDTYIDRNTCVRNCVPNMFVFNRTCVLSCPESHPIKARRRNFEETFNPSNYTLLTYATHCVTNCYDTASVWQHEVLFKDTCVSFCPTGYYNVNNSCVDECPIDYMFLHEGNCLSKCPGNLFGVNGSCFQHCPIGLFGHNITCINQCPPSHGFIYDRICVKHCPSYYVIYNTTCLSRCPRYAAFYHNNNTCLEKCPSSNPYNRSTSSYRYTYQCVLNCDSWEVTFKYKCMSDCPEGTVVFKTECLTKCPESDPLTYRKKHYRSFRYECVRECPETAFTWENNCFDECPSSRPYSFSRTCLENCPSTHRFAEHNSGRCMPGCSQTSVVYNTTCYDRCPKDLPYLVNKQCRQECPESLKLTSSTWKGYVCADHCLDPFILYNNSCVYKCPAGTIIINNTCVNGQLCPKEYSYEQISTHGTVCYKVCPKESFGDGNTCSPKCADKKLQLESERICVLECPDTHPLTDNTTEAKCVRSCGDGLLELTEHKLCITSVECYTKKKLYSYNNEKCVRYCPGGSFLSFKGNQCILVTIDYLIPAVLLWIIGTGTLIFLCVLCCRQPNQNTVENKENDTKRFDDYQQTHENLLNSSDSTEEIIINPDEDVLCEIADESNMNGISLEKQDDSINIPLHTIMTGDFIHESSNEIYENTAFDDSDGDETYLKVV